jgi:hypothetical protein
VSVSIVVLPAFACLHARSLSTSGVLSLPEVPASTSCLWLDPSCCSAAPHSLHRLSSARFIPHVIRLGI